MDEDQWLAAAAGAGGVVVQSRPSHIEEFAAHLRPYL